MNYETFVTELLDALRNNNKHAISLIEQNEKLIQANLDEKCNVITMDKFINDIIDIVVDNSIKKYDVIKKTLKHKSMAVVYRNFNNSIAMIKAVEANNTKALDWLLSLKVSPTVQDENGMNVLMHVVQNRDLNSYVKTFASDKTCLNQEDDHGRTALFYALSNAMALWKLEECGIDINHRDHEGNNVLIYCCKYKKLSHLKHLLKQKVDVNAVDNEGRTAGMYLAMNGYYADAICKGTFGLYNTIMTGDYSTFVTLRAAGFNINYINEMRESALSLLLKHMYKSVDTKKFDNYVRTLISMIFNGCKFNTPLDKDDNTALMIFLLINDYESFNFVTRYCNHIDFSKKNKNGESITSLYMKNKNELFFRSILKLSTADIDYTDPTNGNNLLMLAVITRPYHIADLLNKKPELLHEINHKGENALIIACKANKYKSVEVLLNSQTHVNLNNQDRSGNTALHYAVRCRNPRIVQLLKEKGANGQLKNFNNQSPFDLAMELGDKSLLRALKGDLSSEEALQLMQENDHSKALEDIEEYLYPNITVIEYRGVVLTEEMIKTASTTYTTLERERKSVHDREKIKNHAIRDFYLYSIYSKD